MLTPLGSSMGASSLTSAATTLVFATVRIASKSWGKVTPPASAPEGFKIGGDGLLTFPYVEQTGKYLSVSIVSGFGFGAVAKKSGSTYKKAADVASVYASDSKGNVLLEKTDGKTDGGKQDGSGGSGGSLLDLGGSGKTKD